eukprot:scaffold3876_cov344-Prasinococcus_capsulatus_cf.AAC.2
MKRQAPAALLICEGLAVAQFLRTPVPRSRMMVRSSPNGAIERLLRHTASSQAKLRSLVGAAPHGTTEAPGRRRRAV